MRDAVTLSLAARDLLPTNHSPGGANSAIIDLQHPAVPLPVATLAPSPVQFSSIYIVLARAMRVAAQVPSE